MVSHPNRSKNNPKPGHNPSPHEIVNARTMAKLTQEQAADLLYKSASVWQKWEIKDKKNRDRRSMPPDSWELFLIKTGMFKQYLDNRNMFKDLSTPDAPASKTSERGKRGG